MPETILRLQQRSDELISDEVKEIVSYRPHWMIRKGNAVFFLILGGLLALTWFISYPDIVKASAKLVALNAPKLVNAKQDGKLVKLFVKNEDYVTAGQPLAYLQSTANHDQVLQLNDWIDKTIILTQNDKLEVLEKFSLPQLMQLGELQNEFQEFENTWVETRQFLASGYYQRKKAALQKDLQFIAELKSNTSEQKKLLQQDQQLQQNEYKAYESLAKEKVIAPLELNQYKSKLLSKQQSLEQINTQITNSELASHNKKKELLDLDKQVLDQEQKFHSSMLNLKSDIDKWIEQYIVLAPENGKVFFINSLQENQLLTNNQELFYIQAGQSNFYCDMTAAQNGLGKVKPGQKVILKAQSYPSEEYGYIVGKIDYISNLPNRRDSFLIKVQLPDGLKTNYKREIFFRNNLSATADIITDDRRLFDRMLGQLKKLTER